MIDSFVDKRMTSVTLYLFPVLEQHSLFNTPDRRHKSTREVLCYTVYVKLFTTEMVDIERPSLDVFSLRKQQVSEVRDAEA